MKKTVLILITAIAVIISSCIPAYASAAADNASLTPEAAKEYRSILAAMKTPTNPYSPYIHVFPVLFMDLDHDGIQEMTIAEYEPYYNNGHDTGLYNINFHTYSFHNGSLVDSGRYFEGSPYGAAGYNVYLALMKDGQMCLCEEFGDEHFRGAEYTYYTLDGNGSLHLEKHDRVDVKNTVFDKQYRYFDYDLYINDIYQGRWNSGDIYPSDMAESLLPHSSNEEQKLMGPFGALIGEEPSPAMTLQEAFAYLNQFYNDPDGETGLYQIQAYNNANAYAQIDLKSSPSDNASNIMNIPPFTPVNVIQDQGNGWALVEYQGTTGWVKLKNTQIIGSYNVESPAYGFISPSYYMIVNTEGEGLELRSAPTAEAATFGPMYDGTVVTVTAIQNDWAYVDCNGRKGWAYTHYMRYTGEAPEPAAANNTYSTYNEKTPAGPQEVYEAPQQAADNYQDIQPAVSEPVYGEPAEWKDMYINALQNNGNLKNVEGKTQLIYLDEDDIPELIVHWDGDENDTIYWIADGYVHDGVLYGNVYGKGIFDGIMDVQSAGGRPMNTSLYKEKKGLIYVNFTASMITGNWDVYRLENGEFECEYQFSTYGAQPMINGVLYSIEEFSTISKEAFDSMDPDNSVLEGEPIYSGDSLISFIRAF